MVPEQKPRIANPKLLNQPSSPKSQLFRTLNPKPLDFLNLSAPDLMLTSLSKQGLLTVSQDVGLILAESLCVGPVSE